jgi:hypothetical protein
MRALLVLLALAACHHDGAAPAAPVSTSDQDALWKLAPDGAVFGIVVSPRALAMVDHGWSDVRAFMATVPELASIRAAAGGDPSLASVGLSASAGGAVFVVEAGKTIAIVPSAVDCDGNAATYTLRASSAQGAKLELEPPPAGVY